MNSQIDSSIVMPDVQSSADTRHISIQRVGVRGVRHPMLVAQADGTPLPTVAQGELTVALPAHEKGTTLSRFVALLETYLSRPMPPALFCRCAQDMMPLPNSQESAIAAAFTF